MTQKIAIITQSYKNDYNECKLLCESIDRFSPELDHFIFVNDEDIKLFQSLKYGTHKVYKKSTILPWFMVRVPFKILGHHFHISPITIPVREWIIQQICKLGVFEVIGDKYEAVFNIDSETVFMKPFNISRWKKNGKYIMYRVNHVNEPSHDEYCQAAKKLLKLPQTLTDIGKYNYMNTPVCFVKENTNLLLQRIKKNSIWRNWKIALCNTYRFSEYYTYGIFTDKELKLKNHSIINKHLFPQIDISECPDTKSFVSAIKESLSDPETMGLWLQKKNRKLLSDKYLDFNKINEAIHQYWENHE